MRILLLTQWFEPEPALKGLTFARRLKALGYEVKVVTGFPNYPEGKLYQGYRLRFYQHEIIDGIPVVRVPLYPSHDRSSIKRLLNYLSFAASASIIGTCLCGPVDIIYVYHPPGTIGLPALVMKLFRKAPFVYDVQDLWPEAIATSGMLGNKMVLKLIGAWCKIVYSQAEKIIVLSPGFKNALIARGVSGKKIEVIYNWSDEGGLGTAGVDGNLKRGLGLEGRFNIVFAGTMGQGQAMEAVVKAAGILQGEVPKIQFVFIGGGTEVDRLKNLVEKMKIENVLLLKKIPMTEISNILNMADVLLVHLKDDPLFSITIPSKTQAYMAAGKPILMGVRGDAARLTTAAGAGIVCIPEDPASIAERAKQLFLTPPDELIKMGNNARRFYEKELCEEVGVRKFDEVFKKVLSRRQKVR